MWVRDFDGARAAYEELATLADRIGDAWNGAIALNNLGDIALNSGEWERVVELCGKSSAIRRELGDRWGSALALSNVAEAEIQLGRLADAGGSLRGALEDSLAVGAVMVVAACLDSVAELASALDKTADAARILGASARIHDELGSVRDCLNRARSEATAAEVCASLGKEAFAAEFERGRAMSLEEAAAQAFARSRSPVLTLPAEGLTVPKSQGLTPAFRVRSVTKA